MDNVVIIQTELESAKLPCGLECVYEGVHKHEASFGKFVYLKEKPLVLPFVVFFRQSQRKGSHTMAVALGICFATGSLSCKGAPADRGVAKRGRTGQAEILSFSVVAYPAY